MVKTLSLIFGVILALLGLLGFVNNPLIGMNALFAAGAVDNLIHLVLGIVLLAVALRAPRRAALALKAVGLALFCLGLFGWFGAADWLDLALGVALFLASYWNDVPASARVS
jgi:hypothetical protein